MNSEFIPRQELVSALLFHFAGIAGLAFAYLGVRWLADSEQLAAWLGGLAALPVVAGSCFGIFRRWQHEMSDSSLDPRAAADAISLGRRVSMLVALVGAGGIVITWPGSWSSWMAFGVWGAGSGIALLSTFYAIEHQMRS